MCPRYVIRVRGRLDRRWARHFDALRVRPRDDGTTELEGPVPDQSALHGHLRRIHELGLPLLELRLEPRRAAASGADAAPREAR